ncbi:MAG: glutamine synthetase family protein [Rhodospirillaceae bacterium]|nr:glutamine synthetase family protein [Rhodospirillaceae bacterium]
MATQQSIGNRWPASPSSIDRSSVGGASSPFDPRRRSERERTYKEAVKRMQERGVKNVQFEVVDLNSMLRGKYSPVGKVKETGISFAAAIYALTYGEEFFEAPFGNYGDGFPNAYAVPDLDTFIQWPWRKDMSSVLTDMYLSNGDVCMLDPRQILRSVVRRADAMGYEGRFSLEYEFHLFYADDDAIREKRYRDLKPFGRIPHAYALHRFPNFDHLAETFMERMEQIGIHVEGVHTELGAGALEYALAPLPALQAADAAMRTKLYLKQLAAEHGLIATFMTKWHEEEVACGGHHHLSLWRGGKPALHDPANNDLSEVGRHFVAGMSQTLPDVHLLMRATANTYRRVDVKSWNPENNAWGYDNRTAALRFIQGFEPSAYRFENRCPGSDVNPYLSIAAMLAGGLHGIQQRLQPPQPAVGNPVGDSRWQKLSTTLEGSIRDFEQSRFAREWLGEDFARLMVLKSRAELAGWNKQTDPRVSTWEYDRYFESA